MASNTYSIKDLEQLTGIKAHTIRIWEKRYDILDPARTDTNIRCYSDNDLKKILNISILIKHGFKISKVAELSFDEISERIINLSQSAHDNDSQIDNLVLAMIELDERKFDKTLTNATINLGFEECILRIVYPFLEKIGILWQTGAINPAQEHFITNLLRQKIIAAIDGLIFTPSADSKRFILFLPENEYHELGLLFYYYLLKKNGHMIIYLGQNVPHSDLIQVSQIKETDYLLTSIVITQNTFDFQSYLRQLSSDFKDKQIYISGLAAQNASIVYPANINIVTSAVHFKEILRKGF